MQSDVGYLGSSTLNLYGSLELEALGLGPQISHISHIFPGACCFDVKEAQASFQGPSNASVTALNLVVL
jgi:hypothetical protein